MPIRECGDVFEVSAILAIKKLRVIRRWVITMGCQTNLVQPRPKRACFVLSITLTTTAKHQSGILTTEFTIIIAPATDSASSTSLFSPNLKCLKPFHLNQKIQLIRVHLKLYNEPFSYPEPSSHEIILSSSSQSFYHHNTNLLEILFSHFSHTVLQDPHDVARAEYMFMAYILQTS